MASEEWVVSVTRTTLEWDRVFRTEEFLSFLQGSGRLSLMGRYRSSLVETDRKDRKEEVRSGRGRGNRKGNNRKTD